MSDQALTPAEFGRAFIDAMLAAAVPRPSPVQERIAGHLGGDATHLPVVTEVGSDLERPNPQRALDGYAGLVLVEDDQVVQTFSAQCPDRSLDDRVRTR